MLYAMLALLVISAVFSTVTAATTTKAQSPASARELYKQVRILCMVMTTDSRHESFAVHLKRTWSERCNRVLFMSDREHNELETRVFKSSEKWGLVRRSFRFVHDYHLTEADWFMKVEDDGFVITENLRYLLRDYSPEEPLYFGYRFKTWRNESFMYGSTGYVLSKEALRRFVHKALPNPDICRADDDGYEDLEMGKCLSAVNVRAGDSRDAEGRHTFMPIIPHVYFKGIGKEERRWLEHYSYYSVANKNFTLSPLAISFPNLSYNEMYDINYLIYRLRIFGKNN